MNNILKMGSVFSNVKTLTRAIAYAYAVILKQKIVSNGLECLYSSVKVKCAESYLQHSSVNILSIYSFMHITFLLARVPQNDLHHEHKNIYIYTITL